MLPCFLTVHCFLVSLYGCPAVTESCLMLEYGFLKRTMRSRKNTNRTNRAANYKPRTTNIKHSKTNQKPKTTN